MAMPRLRLEGQVFGRLTVTAYAGKLRRGVSIFTCRCECGNATTVRGRGLVSGATRSCGCLARESTSVRNRRRLTKHGQSGSLAYRSWASMMARCYKPATVGYRRYGGRGIMVCARWHDFANFLADMGERPGREYSIDRIDNDENYEPANCRWATAREQQRNKSNGRIIDVEGQQLSLTEWSERSGISLGVLSERLRHGWDAAEAVRTPVRVYRREGV
jgi:hypothetical protein